MLHCFSICFLPCEKMSSEQALGTKALTLEKARLSYERTACSHLHFLLLHSHWHSTGELKGRGKLTVSGNALRDLTKGRQMLCLVTLVWSYPAIHGCLAEAAAGLGGDAYEVSRLLATWRSRSVSSDGGKTQTRVPGLLLPSTGSGGVRSSSTMGYSQPQHPPVAPDRIYIFRAGREVLCCIQPGFHTVASWYRASDVPPQHWAEEIQLSYRSMSCKRGNRVWGEEIQVSEEEFRVGKAWQLYRWNHCQMLIVFCVVFNWSVIWL